MKQSSLLIRLAAATGLCFGIVDCATAVEQSRLIVSGPANYCQSALPVFDGNIRKRPLAVQNEGATNAFVTCSFAAQADVAGGNLLSISVIAKTSGGVDAMLSCTGVAGYEGELGGNQIVVKSRELQATGGRGSLSWNAFDDFEGHEFPLPFSISCNLLPGMALLESYITITEDVGD